MIVLPYFLSILALAAAYMITRHYEDYTFWRRNLLRKIVIRLFPVLFALGVYHDIFRYFKIEATFVTFIIVILPAFALGDFFSKKMKK